MIRRTSTQTYYEIVKSGLISDKRMKVFDIFYENQDGLTGSQVSDIFKSKYPTAKHSETIRNRITELQDMGVIAELGIVICPFTKRKVMKWCCVDNLPKKIEKKQTKKEKITEILSDIAILGKSLENEEHKIMLRHIYHKLKSLDE